MHVALFFVIVHAEKEDESSDVDEECEKGKGVCPLCKRGKHPLVVEGLMDEEFADILQEPAIQQTPDSTKKSTNRRIKGARLMTGIEK